MGTATQPRCGIMNKNPLKCKICGLFMSYDDAAWGIRVIPFGRPTDQEPPDPEFIHGKCWGAMHQNQKDLWLRANWRVDGA